MVGTVKALIWLSDRAMSYCIINLCPKVYISGSYKDIFCA